MDFPFPDGELGQWAALGGVTDRAVRVWIRDPELKPTTARLSLNGEIITQSELRPSPDHDGIAACDLESAEPRPETPFTVEVNGFVRSGYFAPAAGTPSAFAFAFGSCHQPFLSPESGSLVVHGGARIYADMDQVLHRFGARFLLFAGDQVYSDSVDPINIRKNFRENGLPLSDTDLVDAYRHLYRGFFNQTSFRRLQEAFPSYFIWDDHDIYDGAGSQLRVDEFDRRLFRAAEVTYREYQHLRNPGTSVDDRAPYHYDFWYGDCGFLVLDLRGVRNYQTGTLLGERQWSDLDAFLHEAEERGATTVFLVLSIPLVHHSPALMRLTEWVPGRKGTDVRDRWGVEPYWTNRNGLLERLLNWQATAPRRQIFILSGDVHTGGAFEIRRHHGPGLIHQWASSPLTTPTGLQHRVANLVGTGLVNWGQQRYRVVKHGLENRNNFGLVRVTPREFGGNQVEFLLYGHAQGEVLRQSVKVIAQPS